MTNPKPKLVPYPIGLDQETVDRADVVRTANPWLKQADVLRIAISIGLAQLEKGATIKVRGINDSKEPESDVAKAVLEALE